MDDTYKREQQLRENILAQERRWGARHSNLIVPLMALARFYTTLQRHTEAENSLVTRIEHLC